MKQWTKRLIFKAVAAVVAAAIAGVMFGIVKFLSWVFSLIPKTSQKLDPYSVVLTIVVCFVISILGELVGWIWKKIRRKKKGTKEKKEDDDDDDDDN